MRSEGYIDGHACIHVRSRVVRAGTRARKGTGGVRLNATSGDGGFGGGGGGGERAAIALLCSLLRRSAVAAQAWRVALAVAPREANRTKPTTSAARLWPPWAGA